MTKEKLIKCKQCEREIKSYYLLSSGICGSCDTENKRKDEESKKKAIFTAEEAKKQKEGKKCPYCSEKVRWNAIKCRFCKEFLDNKTNENRYNKVSIIGFVLSIISIFGLGLAGLIGFIMGIVGLNQIKHTKERGRVLAIAAIIIGFIWSFVTGILKRLIEVGF